MLITSFFTFLFCLVSFQDAASQFVANRILTLNITNFNVVSPPPSAVSKYRLTNVYPGSDKAEQNASNALVDYPGIVMSWTLQGDEAFYQMNPLHLTLNRDGIDEAPSDHSVNLAGVISTTETTTIFTAEVNVSNIRLIIVVNLTHNLQDCSARITSEDINAACVSTFEPNDTKCYRQIASTSGFLRNTCAASCPDLELTIHNDTTRECQMAQCSSRKANPSIMNKCGPACYQQINGTSGVFISDCALTCPDTLLTQQNSITGQCEMKSCGSRLPTTTAKFPCGRGCYKQITSSTGAEEQNCRTICPDGKLTRTNPSTGKCVMKTCATRVPNIDVNPPCGALCNLLANLTCEGIGGSDVDEGEGEDEPDVAEGPVTEAVNNEDPWKNVKTTLAIALPIMAVVAILILVVCIVLVVLNAPKEEKKSSFDTAEDGQEAVAFPWKGKSPAPVASPAPLSADKDTAGTGTSMFSTPSISEKTPSADTSTTPAPAPAPAVRKSTRKSVKRKSTTKKLADQGDI